VSRRLGLLLFIIATSFIADVAAAQGVFVYPRRPQQSRVRYFDFEWMHTDVLVGEEMSVRASTISARPLAFTQTTTLAADAEPPPIETSSTAQPVLASAEEPTKAGGMKLYFYTQEDTVAQRAAGSITDTYREYVDSFQYVPRETFPYVLYSSYQEFLQTSLFPVSEGVLGVTSTQDLKLALPYFGDYRLFREVSRHEMAHQFTIQKTREVAEELEVRNPLEQFPLWFIEGLAEYYAKSGVDVEAELLALDLVLNANIERGYGLIGFFEDRPYSVLWTYKIGQVRVAFLEDTYGAGTIQRLLEYSPLMVADIGNHPRVPEFPRFVATVVGDEPGIIAGKFEAWLKRRMLPRYLAAKQSRADLLTIPGFDPDFVESFNASPSGSLILYRTIDFETGQSKLILFDHRTPWKDESVATDGVPGVESLHPISGQNYDLTDEALAFIAQDGGADVIYWAPIEHEAAIAQQEARSPLQSSDGKVRIDPGWDLRGGKRPVVWETSLDVGGRTKYTLGEKGIVAAYAPSFSPEGDKIAFVGLDITGARDIYILTGAGTDEWDLIRVTDDEYAERSVAWGPKGIYFSSDRTPHAMHNLFRVKPEAKAEIVPVTSESRDHFDPLVLPDGTVMFVAIEDGRGNAFEATESQIIQRTDLPTGIFDLAPGPEGGMWALFQYAGERRIVRITRDKFLNLAGPSGLTAGGADNPLADRPHLALGDAELYRPWSPSNWQLDNVFALAGVGGGSIFGRAYATASDRLRTHGLVLTVDAYGSLDLTDARLLYINEAERFTWGAGPFQEVTFQVDPTFPTTVPLFASGERFFGGFGIIRYPFDRFLFIQGELAFGGVDYVLDRVTAENLRNYPGTRIGENALDVWRDRNQEKRFQSTASVSLGYDTIRYHPGTGPITGRSLLLEGTLVVQPFDDEVYSTARIDLEQYFQIIGRVNFFIRGGAGSTFGGTRPRQFYLSSFDTLRGVEFGTDNAEFLIGKSFWFSTAELQIPLNAILALAFLTDIEGIAGFDFGGVGTGIDKLWDKRVLNLVLGFNFGLGPLVLRLHFARPFDIGAGKPNNSGDWVTNFSLGWLYL
jgi:hypothetical protein